MSSPQTEMTTGFDNVGKAIEETGSIFLRPFLFLVSAARGKFTATQLKYLREQVVYYFDPMSLEEDVEIAQIQKMNPSLWRVWRMELEAITMMYYVIFVVTKFASGLMPEMLTALPRKEQELLERQAKFLSALAEAIAQTEDVQMKASFYRLGRRLFAGWVVSIEVRKFAATQLKYLREQVVYYFDPMSLEKDVEIAQIQKLNPSLWRVWRTELETITMIYSVILMVTNFSAGQMPEVLTVQLSERQAKFLSALAEAVEQTDDAQMKASVYRLGRRLFAGWAASSEAREFMANLPKLAQEREEYIASFYGQAGMGPNNVHQQIMAKLLTKFFDDGNSWSSLPLYTAEQMRNQEAYLRYLLANPEATIE